MSSVPMQSNGQIPALLFDKYEPDIFYYKVLALILNKPEFRSYAVQALKPEFFASNKVVETYATILLDFFKRFPDDMPTTTVYYEELRKRLDKKQILPEELQTYSDARLKFQALPPDAGYVEEAIRQYATKKTMEFGIAQAIGYLNKGQFDQVVEKVKTAYASSLPVIFQNEALPICSSTRTFFEQLKNPALAPANMGVSCGIEALDQLLFFHGVGKGELFTVCGPPNSGKSPFLQNVAEQATLKGLTGIYYTLEVSAEIMKYRRVAMLCSVPIVDLHQNVQLLEERWTKLEDLYKMGETYLYDLPARSLKPSHIRRDIDSHLSQGRPLHYLIVDYADIMKGDQTVKLEDRRLEHGGIYEDLRAIMKEFEISGFTASQGNKMSLNKAEVDIDSMSEDFSKAMTSDYVVGISQTKAEKKMVYTNPSFLGTGRMRGFLAKNRNQQKGVSVGFWTDFTKMRMCADEWLKFDETVFGIPNPMKASVFSAV